MSNNVRPIVAPDDMKGLKCERRRWQASLKPWKLGSESGLDLYVETYMALNRSRWTGKSFRQYCHHEIP